MTTSGRNRGIVQLETKRTFRIGKSGTTGVHCSGQTKNEKVLSRCPSIGIRRVSFYVKDNDDLQSLSLLRILL